MSPISKLHSNVRRIGTQHVIVIKRIHFAKFGLPNDPPSRKTTHHPYMICRDIAVQISSIKTYPISPIVIHDQNMSSWSVFATQRVFVTAAL